MIIFSDEHLLIVNKPAGALSVAGSGDAPTVESLLQDSRLIAADERPRIVHRLDRDASGVMAFARTLIAQQSLTSQFESRTVAKSYFTIVSGTVAADGGVDLPISASNDGRSARIDPAEGKPSVTQFRVIERFVGYSALTCHPLTGRLHQIRVHMHAIGHPLAVDPIYARVSELRLSNLKRNYKPGRTPERPLISRLTLHAQTLEFDHPTTAERMIFHADLPKDLRALQNQLRKL